jgi:sirohydrochlorin cobaltochelatase
LVKGVSGVTDAAVLVIAHGSPDPDWIRLVEETVSHTKLNVPVRAAYLGGVPGRSIADEVCRLERMGAEAIITVPLFVTAGSSHVNEIQYMLGLLPSAGFSSDVQKIPVETPIVWSPPLEDHPIVEEIVAERVRALTDDPSQEALLLVGHGSEWPGLRERWERLLQRMAVRLQNRFSFSAAWYATLRPDTVAERACLLASEHKLVVVPLFVSQGYFTRQAIPGRLAGVPFRYTGETYLPHPLVSDWIAQSALAACRTLQYEIKECV